MYETLLQLLYYVFYFSHIYNRYSMGLGNSTRAVNMSGETAKFVMEAINKDPVVIFSTTYCPYCNMAKEVC